MEACTTLHGAKDDNGVRSYFGFKTVNGMEACTTTVEFCATEVEQYWFQNRKRYGSMHDMAVDVLAGYLWSAKVSKP